MNGVDIEWASFALVAVVVLLGSVLLTAFYAGGVRLLESSGHSIAARSGAYVCFAVCISAVLFGLWIVVPQFH